MEKAEFLSKSVTYEGDYDVIMRSPSNEFKHGLHYHDFFELVIHLGNTGTFYMDNANYPLRRGDMVVIDMFKPHRLILNESSYYQRFSICVDLPLLISFSTSNSNLLDIFHRNSTQSPVHHLGEGKLDKYLPLIEQYLDFQHLRRENQGYDIFEKSLIHQLLAHAYIDCYNGKHIDKTEVQHLQIIAKILTYINENLSEEIMLSRLADEVSYSESYVCRLFKKITGKTLTNYIQEKRIEEAAFLLRTHESVNKAAEQVGFNNYSYFYKTFKKFMGCGPSEYQVRYK